jgi:hypothetical protein
MKCENCEVEMDDKLEACPNCGWVQGSSKLHTRKWCRAAGQQLRQSLSGPLNPRDDRSNH